MEFRLEGTEILITMSVSISINCGGDETKETVFVSGQRAVDRHWLPTIESLHLDLLEVALTGGLPISREYYPVLVQQVTTLLSKFTQMVGTSADAEGLVFSCRRLLEILKAYPPESGCTLYLG